MLKILNSVPFWIAALVLLALIVLRDRDTGRSALYSCAVFLQRCICLFAALLPAAVRVIEAVPNNCREAWVHERAQPPREEKLFAAPRAVRSA